MTLREFRAAYLDYVEGERSDKPSMDGLSRRDQRRASSWIASLDAARGVDPYAERPSTKELARRVAR